uniref:DUF5641 domain-containing protein n=1 Tax=Glossina palpalis gambiensis TaxID=67801 RepID=A0A1B0BQR6_9MUSC
MKWPLERIIHVHSVEDGVVRVVEIINVITDAYNGRICPLLLSPHQLNGELTLFKGHLPTLHALSMENDNLIELYKLVIRNETLITIISDNSYLAINAHRDEYISIHNYSLTKEVRKTTRVNAKLNKRSHGIGQQLQRESSKSALPFRPAPPINDRPAKEKHDEMLIK